MQVTWKRHFREENEKALDMVSNFADANVFKRRVFFFIVGYSSGIHRNRFTRS